MPKATLTPRQRVNRLWRNVGDQYGGGPVPDIRFGKVPSPGNARAVTQLFPDGESIIHVGHGLTRQLRSRDPRVRRSVRNNMLWELGRTIQGGRGDPWLMHKTNKVSHQLNKQQEQRRKATLHDVLGKPFNK